jgi:hypothetical protein
MNSSLRLAAFLALLLVGTSVFANAPPPDLFKEPAPPVKAPAGVSVPVEVSYAQPNGNSTAKIVIPAATLASLVEAAKANKSLTLPLGVVEPSQPNSGFPHGGMIIAGLALSLAMVSMVYLLRRKPAHRWAVTGTAVVLLGLGVTGYLWADIRIPGQPYNGPARRPNEPGPIPQPQGPMVTIEVSEKGNAIQIIVPPQGP